MDVRKQLVIVGSKKTFAHATRKHHFSTTQVAAASLLINWRDGVVVRSSVSQSVMGFIP